MASKAHRSGQVCPKGHYMDPNWVVCPYCEAEDRSKKKSSKPEITSEPEAVSASDVRKTRVGQVPPAPSDKRVTSAMPAMDASGRGAGPGVVDTRCIVGVMVSYTWRPEGEVFTVREGKNYIGADRIADDPSHRFCDIHVPNDPKMSGQHALILCREGSYELIDKEATNGTKLDGKRLSANISNDLPAQAEIKAGSTVFTFMAVPHGSHETLSSPRTEEEPPPREDRGGGKSPTTVR